MQKDFAEQKATKLAERRYGGQLISSRKVLASLCKCVQEPPPGGLILGMQVS